ncbi:MAG: 2-dehydro-3-deoxygalactonokinase [Paucibacter sp.]|nr:2-dehydro-3-deoxygalactonokinase [Roseateles sp.]
MVNASDLEQAQLIGLDWGSSSLRAMLIDAQGLVLEMRASPQGASTLSGGAAGFSRVLDALIDDWRVPGLPLLACGMVGSQHGWREVPYARCPANAATLAAGALSVDWRGLPLHLMPGLRCDTAAGVPDVMRGEETQILGAGVAQGCVILPGTHSKWAQVVDGEVRSFATHMTGEMFALLRQHSVLGRLMPAQAGEDPAAFAQGVLAARDQGGLGLLHQLFAVRTLGLTGQLPHASLADYLSGLLIGHEVRAGLASRQYDAPLVLIGEPALCRRYGTALEQFDSGPVPQLPNTAAAGLRDLARLVPGVL